MKRCRVEGGSGCVFITSWKRNDQMSSGEAAASRSSAARGTRAASLRGRLDERAWRDVTRAIRIGKESDAHSVEIHGVRITFKRSVHYFSQDTQEEECPGAPASHRRNEPTRGSRMAPGPPPPNSAQRRSAARMAKYILAKKGSGTSLCHDPAATAGTSAQAPALVEPDERASAPMETAGGRARGRFGSPAVVHSTACPATITLSQQPSCDGQRAKRPAEAARRDRRGLRPPSPASMRRMCAADALESRRAAATQG